MSNAKISALLEKLELDVQGDEGNWRFELSGRLVMIITDESADRMRVIAPIVSSAELSEELLRRAMQSNFDSALDARYAIAKETLWSAFIHPLSSLSEHELLLGIGQVVNLVTTFGSSFSSGLLLFGGGDSQGIREQELLEALVNKGLAI